MKELSAMSNAELWAIFPIMLEAYNPAWPQWYAQEEQLLRDAIGVDTIVRIRHIGSTAVEGLLAKPTIDILLEIPDAADIASLRDSLAACGYILLDKPENSPPHSMGLKGYTPQGFAQKVFHLHIRYAGDWDEPIFCDYLRAHPETAAAYAALKRELAAEFTHDRDGYTEAKGDFICKITAIARGRD